MDRAVAHIESRSESLCVCHVGSLEGREGTHLGAVFKKVRALAPKIQRSTRNNNTSKDLKSRMIMNCNRHQNKRKTNSLKGFNNVLICITHLDLIQVPQSTLHKSISDLGLQLGKQILTELKQNGLRFKNFGIDTKLTPGVIQVRKVQTETVDRFIILKSAFCVGAVFRNLGLFLKYPPEI